MDVRTVRPPTCRVRIDLERLRRRASILVIVVGLSATLVAIQSIAIKQVLTDSFAPLEHLVNEREVTSFVLRDVSARKRAEGNVSFCPGAFPYA